MLFVRRHIRGCTFFRKLCSFNVNTTFITMFYSHFVESVLIFSFIAWFLVSGKQKNSLQGIVKVCCKIAGSNMSVLS